MIAWAATAPASRARGHRRSTRSPSSAQVCGGATRTRRSSRELRASAARLGRSPTMREFAADSDATVHPQTVIEHFGTWNAAKRAAGLHPRRFISREELVAQLRELGDELGRTPTVRDIEARRGRDGLEVAHLAHVRLARGRAQGSGLRRAGRRGAARARDRRRRAARPRARPSSEDGRVEGRPPTRCDVAVRMAGLPPGGREPGRVVGVPVPRERAACARKESRSGPDGTCPRREPPDGAGRRGPVRVQPE